MRVVYISHAARNECRNVNMRSRDEAATVKDGSRPLIFNSNSSAVNFVPKLALR